MKVRIALGTRVHLVAEFETFYDGASWASSVCGLGGMADLTNDDMNCRQCVIKARYKQDSRIFFRSDNKETHSGDY